MKSTNSAVRHLVICAAVSMAVAACDSGSVATTTQPTASSSTTTVALTTTTTPSDPISTPSVFSTDLQEVEVQDARLLTETERSALLPTLLVPADEPSIDLELSQFEDLEALIADVADLRVSWESLPEEPNPEATGARRLSLQRIDEHRWNIALPTFEGQQILWVRATGQASASDFLLGVAVADRDEIVALLTLNALYSSAEPTSRAEFESQLDVWQESKPSTYRFVFRSTISTGPPSSDLEVTVSPAGTEVLVGGEPDPSLSFDIEGVFSALERVLATSAEAWVVYDELFGFPVYFRTATTTDWVMEFEPLGG